MIRTNSLASRSPILAAILLLTTIPSVSARSGADEPAADSPMVKLLKSGRVPEERQGTVIEMIGRRGSVADLGFIYQRALDARPRHRSGRRRSKPWPRPRRHGG